MPQSAELQLALRKKRGERLRPAWFVELNKAAGLELGPADLLTLEQTDLLKDRFVDELKKRSTERKYLGKQASRAVNVARDLLERVPLESSIMFHNLDELIGAVRIPLKSVFHNLRSVWRVAGQDLSLTTDDAQHGLCLEENHFYEEENGVISHGDFYELRTWGVFASDRRGQ